MIKWSFLGGLLFFFISQYAQAAGPITTSQEITAPLTVVNPNVKYADFHVVHFNDNQQFDYLNVTVIRLTPGVKVLVKFQASGQLGAGIDKWPTPVTIDLMAGPATLGSTAPIQWYSPCHQVTPFSGEMILPSVDFDTIDTVGLPTLNGNDYGC